MKSFGLLAAALPVAGLLFAAQASAQPMGTYVGHTADGNAIRFDVASDPQGQLFLTDLALSFTAPCGEGSAISQSWQFFFSKGLPIANGRVKHVENNPQLFMLNNISFDGRQKATGTTEARLPLLVPGKPPNRVQLCASGKQAFEATFQSADSSNPFDHPGSARLKAPDRTAILEWSVQGVTHQELLKQ